MSTRATVLVIDDEPGMRDMLLYELSQEGFDVMTAESGMAAVEAAKRRKFDIAVTDLKMPGMDGVATVEALRTLDPDIQVIVATGYATVETAVACMKRGAYDYIQKPYDIGELTLLLDRAMQKSHLQGVVALYEASRVLLATLTHDELTGLVVDLAGRVLRAEVIGLLLGEQQVMVDTRGKENQQTLPSDLLRELARCSTEANGPLRLPGPLQKLPAAAEEEGIGSVLVYPLVTRDRRLGHLAVLRDVSQPSFSESELQRGSIFAGQIALSIDNARLYDELAIKIDELIGTREHLVQAEKFGMAARIAGCVAHEINNPLAFVKANLAALRDYSTTIGGLWLAAKAAATHLRGTGQRESLDLAQELLTAQGRSEDTTERVVQEIAEVIDEILEGVKRIAELVSGFNRLTEPLDPAAPEAVDLGVLVQESLASFSIGTEQHGQVFRLETDGMLQAWAAVEDVRIALLNVLAFLCVEHGGVRSHQDRSVSIRCFVSADRPTVEIADPMLKMTEDERLRIFDPRVQVDDRRGRTMRLDLSMSLAYQLLCRNGGNLHTDQSEDGGTVFRIDLPREQE